MYRIVRQTDAQIDWLPVWHTYKQAGWLAGRQTGIEAVKLIGWQKDKQTDRQIDLKKTDR
jgi:hypothetical protein